LDWLLEYAIDNPLETDNLSLRMLEVYHQASSLGLVFFCKSKNTSRAGPHTLEVGAIVVCGFRTCFHGGEVLQGGKAFVREANEARHGGGTKATRTRFLSEATSRRTLGRWSIIVATRKLSTAITWTRKFGYSYQDKNSGYRISKGVVARFERLDKARQDKAAQGRTRNKAGVIKVYSD
jgi:hypothetical protein